METAIQLQTLPLQDIAIGKTNPRKVFDEEALKELTASIREKGILQPLLVRPLKGGYELVCGERRLKAATLAQLTEVPVQIREIPDEAVLEIQLIENLEREDVHPLHEAETLQQMLDTGKYSLEELATKLAKSETFITQRLSLNQLIKPWKEACLKGFLTLGKALIVARLTKEGQKELAKNAMDYVGGIKSKAALEKYIDQHISRKLDQAPFDPLDAQLVKRAGPCTECQKRSGANKRLFPDIENDDQCFDSACFAVKLQAHLMQQVRTIIEEAQPVRFIFNRYSEDIPKGLQKLLEKHEIKVLEQYEDFELHRSGDGSEPVEALWLNSPGKGHREKIYLPQRNKGTMQELGPKEQIERIEQRAARFLELDAEKVHKRIVEAMAESKELNELGELPPHPVDDLLLRLHLWNSAHWEVQQHLAKVFKWIGDVANKTFVQRLEKLNTHQVAYMLRQVTFQLWKNNLPEYQEGIALRKLAEAFPTVPIADIEKEQRQIARKRIKRTKERIQKLKEKC